MELRSPAFKDGERIPKRHCMRGAGGENVSLPFEWTEVPGETRSFALSIVDPHPVANDWAHWLVVDLPPESRSLPEGASGHAMPAGCQELRSSFGTAGYGGPQPPPGSGEHPYVCTVYALNVSRVEIVPREEPLEGFQDAIHQHVVAQASITGTYRQ